MKLNNKIQAFTLTEIAIVIVISTIVAGLAFSVIRIIQKNTSAISENYNKRTIINSLELALKIDFNTFNKITWDEKKQELTLNSPIKEKKYTFYNDSVINNRQSYKIKVFKKSFFFKGKEIFANEIDALKMEFDTLKRPQSFFIFKLNDLTTEFDHGNKN